MSDDIDRVALIQMNKAEFAAFVNLAMVGFGICILGECDKRIFLSAINAVERLTTEEWNALTSRLMRICGAAWPEIVLTNHTIRDD